MATSYTIKYGSDKYLSEKEYLNACRIIHNHLTEKYGTSHTEIETQRMIGEQICKCTEFEEIELLFRIHIPQSTKGVPFIMTSINSWYEDSNQKLLDVAEHYSLTTFSESGKAITCSFSENMPNKEQLATIKMLEQKFAESDNTEQAQLQAENEQLKQQQPTETPRNERQGTQAITSELVYTLLKELNITKQADNTKIAQLIEYITGYSHNTIRTHITKAQTDKEYTGKQLHEIDRVNKLLKETNSTIRINP